MKHHLLFIFCVCVLWLTGIIRITYNDFHHKAGDRFGSFKASHNSNSTIANAKILLPLRRAITGFVTIRFFHTKNGSLETEQAKHHRTR